jgi:hypothetical protein
MRRQRTFTTAAAAVVAVALTTGSPDTEAADPADSGDRIVAPSEYLEDIETPGTEGGVEDEVDSAEAQAEAAERKAEAQKKAEEAARRLKETSGD